MNAGHAVVAAVSGVIGFLVVSSIAGVSRAPRIDYATASLEEKQNFLERKADNIVRGFNLTRGSASEISSVYVDAENDLISISVQLKDPMLDRASGEDVAGLRQVMQKSACGLSDKKLMAETDYTMRFRFLKPSGSILRKVEANSASCL